MQMRGAMLLHHEAALRRARQLGRRLRRLREAALAAVLLQRHGG